MWQAETVGVNYRKKKVEQQERLQRSARKDCDQGDFCWTEACERLVGRMLRYLEDSESTNVSIRELEEQVLFPYESRSNIVRIARQTRNEKCQNLFQIFRQGEGEDLIASKSRWDVRLDGHPTRMRQCRRPSEWRQKWTRRYRKSLGPH